MMRGKWTRRRALLRRIALLESALWIVRARFPEDRAAIESIEWKLNELQGKAA